MRKINITIAQIQSLHGEPEKNLEKAIEIIEDVSKKGSNLVIFPELFYTGYFNRRRTFYELAEEKNGNLFNKLKDISIKNNISIIMGYPEKEDNIYYNSLMFIDNKGNLLCSYRKLYCWKEENKTFTKGDKLFSCDTEFGKIGLLNCYDIEFPELFRILHFKGTELVICPSVWSEWIKNRWHSSLMAGAINNLYYVIGVNTVGLTPLDKKICGNSKVISPFGDVLVEASDTEEEILNISIDLDEVKKIREEYPIWQDYRKEMFDFELLKKY
ncbi:MAG: carbon-nitrogen hydrolase family protein [Fusobacterium perfoetens]|uniref:carbon-nitrogen hydrolase family protein n=1 Tax=Fusobacterium perfoetens TaxID=852 RepID=UPI0023F244FC|nr:carbon-nitrogen hydrolase family protein [Fusobacterium perfoetens]MCI6151634.1 carbon-nitrogen hydrolase family protein [Fusobacterium perfoetens]MDY3237802.1 carbon-nitrogen hydrolase family protein [Fusobacterium perfoetens]